jgi:hypothetical protein
MKRSLLDDLAKVAMDVLKLEGLLLTLGVLVCVLIIE